MAIPSGSTNNWLSNNSSYPGSGTTVFDAGSYNQNLTVNLTGTTYDPTNYSFTFDDTANGQLYSQTYGGGFTDLTNYRTALTWHFWFENLETINVGNPICWMGTRAAGDFYGFGFSKNTSNQLAMDVAYGVTVATTANIQSGWHLASIAWSSASGTFDIYVDGIIDVSNYTGNLFAAGGIISTDAIYFGHSPLSGYAEYYNGRIGQSTLYPTKQNANQVLAFYNDTKTRFFPPIVEYDFSDPACYPGSGSTFYDLAGSTNGSTNSTTFVSNGNASYFTTNGSSTFLSTSSYTPTSSTVFSYNLWFQLNNTTYGTMLQLGGDGSVANTPAINTNDPSANRLNCSFGFNVGVNQPSETIPVDTWKCITVVCDGSTNKVYYDGLLVNSVSQSTGTFGVGPMHFGRFLTFQYASVKIALFQLFDTALNATAVLNNYNTQQLRFNTPPTPIVEYDFQNGSYSGSGTTIIDLQGGETNLTVGNGNWVAGSPNYWDLQADTNLFSDNLAPAFESTTFTINCWYYPDYTTPTEYAAVWSFGNFFNPALPILSTRDNGTINIQWNFGYGIVSTTVTNEWHLFTFVSNGTTTTLYVDGIFIGSNSSSSGYIGTPVVIRLGSASRGAGPSVDFSKGKIGYWTYYDIPLTSIQVLDLYNATESSYVGPPPPPPPYAGLVGGRTFGQGFAG
jgi:hypothetical protein